MPITTEDFVRDCTMLAARALAMEPQRVDAAAILTGLARTATISGHAHPPVHHYRGLIVEALWQMFGAPYDLANTSHRHQEEAVAAWAWAMDLGAGVWPNRLGLAPTLRTAVQIMRNGGEGWRARMRGALRAGNARRLGLAG